jgi:hypothetical protein
VVNIPQRFQAVNGTTAQRAGISLLPLLLMTPFASGLSGYLVSNQKLRVPPLYLTLFGSCLQLIGVGLDSSISTDITHGIQKIQYAYEVLMGLGFGLVLSSLLTLIPFVVDKKDMPGMCFLSPNFLLRRNASAPNMFMGMMLTTRSYDGSSNASPCSRRHHRPRHLHRRLK